MSFIKHTGPTESKYWHFRINDLSNEQFYLLQTLECEWIIIGNLEKENEKGTHYHCAIKFNTSLRRSTALNRVLFNKELKKDNDYYLETKYTKASVEQFIDYAIKNGSVYDRRDHLVQIDNGLIPEPAAPVKLSKLELQKLRIQKAREGDEEWFLLNDFEFMLGNKYPKLLLLTQPHKTDILDGDLCNYWVWGKSGTCKSASIHLLWPKAYPKVVSNSKWDNYSNTDKGHEVVHVEEVDNFDDIKEGLEGLAGLKRMADRYPFPVRFNYGSRNLMIRPKTIVITSNFSPSQILNHGDRNGNPIRGIEIQIEAIKRKFKVIHIDAFKELFNIKDKIVDSKIVGCEFMDTKLYTPEEIDNLIETEIDNLMMPDINEDVD
jgi:hypothetical protein